MKEKIVLIGGGGHCLSCIDVIEQSGEYEIAGIVDREDPFSDGVQTHGYLGDDENIPALVSQFGLFLITIGFIESPAVRIRLYEYAKEAGGKFPVVVSPAAVVSDNARVDSGTVVMHNAVINSGGSVGKNSIVNTGAVIEHGTVVGDHCHISTTAVLNGNCVIGDRVFVGSNATLFHGVQIHDDVLISAGSVVHKNLEKPGVYAGYPARMVGKLQNG